MTWWIPAYAAFWGVLGFLAGRYAPSRTPTVIVPLRTSPPSVLTARQLEIVTIAAEGLTNQEIADKLGVKLETVKFHLSGAYDRLETKNRTGAVRKARELGLLA